MKNTPQRAWQPIGTQTELKAESMAPYPTAQQDSGPIQPKLSWESCLRNICEPWKINMHTQRLSHTLTQSCSHRRPPPHACQLWRAQECRGLIWRLFYSVHLDPTPPLHIGSPPPSFTPLTPGCWSCALLLSLSHSDLVVLPDLPWLLVHCPVWVLTKYNLPTFPINASSTTAHGSTRSRPCRPLSSPSLIARPSPGHFPRSKSLT